MKYSIFQSVDSPGEWWVEAIKPNGEVEVAIFTGASAEARAREYYDWKLGSGC